MNSDHAKGPIWDQKFHDDFSTLLQWRRDVRKFEPRAIDEEILRDCIKLAFMGPSVGNSQPWRLVRIKDKNRLQKLYKNHQRANADALTAYDGQQAKEYASLKLAGLDDAPVQISVFADMETTVGHGVGSQTMPETMAYSVVCLIQNLWLLLRSHGIGLGWVSILDPNELYSDLDVSKKWHFIGHLCIGYPIEVAKVPDLVANGWQQRLEMDDLIIER